MVCFVLPHDRSSIVPKVHRVCAVDRGQSKLNFDNVTDFPPGVSLHVRVHVDTREASSSSNSFSFLLADYLTVSLVLINVPPEDHGQRDPDEISSPGSPPAPWNTNLMSVFQHSVAAVSLVILMRVWRSDVTGWDHRLDVHTRLENDKWHISCICLIISCFPFNLFPSVSSLTAPCGWIHTHKVQITFSKSDDKVSKMIIF